MICVASEQGVRFAEIQGNGSQMEIASRSMDDFMSQDGGHADPLAKLANRAVNQLLVVPDYWIGSRADRFQARKKSVVEAFIERKLRSEQPALEKAPDFFSYAMATDPDGGSVLYTYFLQEPAAYGLYERMADLGINPVRITSPALLWQAKLKDLVDGFDGKGIGVIHLCETDCFLYLFFRGQYLFSRTIQLPNSTDDATQTYNLLNYEINQSFYHYSQKTKSAVETLYLLSSDGAAQSALAELLGREIRPLTDPRSPEDGCVGGIMPVCCLPFSMDDLAMTDSLAISHKPLKRELHWRTVQWTGIAVGAVVAVLLFIETAFLVKWSDDADRQIQRLRMSGDQPPAMVLDQTTSSIEEIRQSLQRPSGARSTMQALLALDDSVSMEKLSVDLSSTPRLTLDAVVHGDDPETFRAALQAFIRRLNRRFESKAPMLHEKDVEISLVRPEGVDDRPVYRIRIGLDLL